MDEQEFSRAVRFIFIYGFLGLFAGTFAGHWFYRELSPHGVYGALIGLALGAMIVILQFKMRH